MGRIFEVRKSTMFARYDRMAKQFIVTGKRDRDGQTTGVSVVLPRAWLSSYVWK